MKVDPAEHQERFLDLIRKNRDRIARICQSWTRTPEDYQDLRSEVYLQLWRSLASFDGRAGVDSWLYRVTLNTALLHARRRRRREPRTESFDEAAGPATPADALSRLEAGERWRRLRRAMLRLGEADRTLVTLWLEELSYRQIAEITGLTENRVGVTLHRAKAKLAQLIAAEEAPHATR